MDSKQQLIHDLAVKAGIVRDEERTLLGERHGCRFYIANLTELSKFARLVGEIARKDEQKRIEGLQNRDKPV